MMDPLPSLNTVFSKVVTEERHHTVIRAQKTKSDVVGFAAYAGARDKVHRRDNDRPRAGGVCSHCAKPGHDKDNCFQLIGFPDWWYVENRVGIGQSREGGRVGRGTTRGSGRSGRTLANAAATDKCTGNTGLMSTQLTDSDRGGLQGLSDDQWNTLVNLLNSSKGQSFSTDKLNGPHLKDFDWSG